jgi:NTE family protein
MTRAIPIELALQGGGAHGAYTWGVLDRLLDEPGLEIASISAASAGAMNAAVLASAYAEGGRSAARDALEVFWKEVADVARLDARDIYPGLAWLPFGPPPAGENPMFDLGLSVMRANATAIAQFVPPSVAWPWNADPLLRLVEQMVKPDLLRQPGAIRLFIAATNVRTSEMRLFDNDDLTPAAVVASACLPKVFAPVEIGGEAYWDGGYLGNPPLLPLIAKSAHRDLLIVQLNPSLRAQMPSSVAEIEGRLNEINFNAPLLKEMAWIKALTDAVKAQPADAPLADPLLSALKDLRLHRIEANETVFRLGSDTKLNPVWSKLQDLRDLGRTAADTWLTGHSRRMGTCSTITWSRTEERLGCA